MNEILARGLITTKSAQIEGLLRHAGAEGVGLRDLRSSLSDALDKETHDQIRYVNRVRNEASHDDGFSISESDLEKFVAAADSVIYKLQRKSLVAEVAHVASTSGHCNSPVISYRAATAKSNSDQSHNRKTLTLKSRQAATADSCSRLDVPEVVPSAKPDEALIRDHQVEEQKSSQADSNMVLKGKARTGLSPETKEKITSGIIKAGFFVLADMLKR